MLTAFIAGRTSGFLFQNASGKPLSAVKRPAATFAPVLDALEVPKAGFHSFRRFRATHLSKSRVPESLARFWIGHSETDQTEQYVKLFDEVVYRKEVADSFGLGFELLPNDPSVRTVCKKSARLAV
jgi:integrase